MIGEWKLQIGRRDASLLTGSSGEDRPQGESLWTPALPSAGRFSIPARRLEAPESIGGRTVRPFAFCILQFAILNLCAGPARAQTSYPMLTSVYPAGLQRGATAELTVTGTNNFAGASGVLFEGKGLSATVVPEPAPKEAPPKPAPGKPPAKAAVNTVTIKVTAAVDAPLGEREFRVLTPRGASSLGVLVVGDEPEQSEKEPNDTPEQAQPLVPPVTMN